MSAIIDALKANSDDFNFEENGRGVAFRPLDNSEESLKLFQHIAEELIDNEGDGYTIHPAPHRTSDHAVDYVDLVVVQLDE